MKQMSIHADYSDHTMANYLRSKNVNWDNVKKVLNVSEYYDKNGRLIAVMVYKDNRVVAVYTD